MSISKINDYLYISSRIKPKDIDAVRDLDIRLIISMIAHLPPSRELSDNNIEVLWLRTFDFPLLPIPVKTLKRGVDAALPVIHDGHSVLVFCQAGRHRSVAMASAILIGMGYSAIEAMQLISRQRAEADPWAKHIQRQIRKYEGHHNEVTASSHGVDT